jgi:hypothetical protein
MRHVALALLLSLGIVLAGCAGPTSGTIDTSEQEERNRNWNGPD